MSSIKCDICFRRCTINEGKIGYCNARKNIDGENISLNYGKFISASLDPIEKKPLHFYKPGSAIFSLGSFGCNMNCQFCQNYSLARANFNDYNPIELSPREAVELSKKYKDVGNIGIAFTYNEPLINFEYIIETGKILKENKLDLVIVTNGELNEKYFKMLLPYVDAFNIDLKSFNEEKYRYLGGDLNIVLNNIKLTAKSSHIEITTLVVPDISDDIEEFKREVEFLSNIDKDIPLHITRYFPSYKYNKPPTDKNLMDKFYNIATKKLNKVTLGNI